MRKAKKRDKIFSCTRISSMYEVFGYYKYASFSLSFKYHPLVLSIGSSVPCVGVICDSDGYYESKMKGAFDSCGLEWKEKLMRIDELDSNTLIDHYEKCIIRRSEYIIKNKEQKQSIYNDALNRYLSIN